MNNLDTLADALAHEAALLTVSVREMTSAGWTFKIDSNSGDPENPWLCVALRGGEGTTATAPTLLAALREAVSVAVVH